MNHGEVLLRVGDQAPPLDFQLLDADGAPVVLGGDAVVALYMRPIAGGDYVVAAGSVGIVDGNSGLVRYSWSTDATSGAPGDYLAEFRLLQGGVESSYPVGRTIVVRLLPRL